MRGTGLVFAVVLASLASSASADPALDKAPFTATPAELLAAAKQAPAGTDAVILREDYELRIDDRGRTTSRWRLVFTVHTQAGADGWQQLTTSWRPAHQDKPAVRARVIDANGRVTEIDAKLITEQPTITASSIASDRRELEVPLPQLSVGAVVEEQITTVDHEALPGGGALSTLIVGNQAPTQDTRFVINAPAGRKLHVIGRALPAGVRPQRTTAKGRQIVTYKLGPQPAPPAFEGWIAPDAITAPYVAVSPAASWQAVAREYRAIIDRRIADGPFALPAELPRAATLETARAIVRWLHRNVRSVEIDLASSAFVPATPAEVVARGAADAKDKAVLLVALLRQAGLRAELALVAPGPGTDLERDAPALNAFEQPLVRVKIAGADVWIDPSDPDRAVGQLSSFAYQRRALVLADDTTALVSTPATTSTANVVREVRTFELAEQGGAKVTEVSRESGVWEAGQREWMRTTSPAQVREDLASYASKEFANATLERYSTTSVEDLATPFEITLVATGSGRALAGRDQIDVHLFPADTLDKLPAVLGDPGPNAPVRKHDFWLPAPYVYELESRLVIPPGFTMPAPAADKTRQLGTMTLVEKHRVDGRTLVVSFRLDTGKQRVTPAEVAKVQDATRALRDEGSLHLVIPNTAVALLDKGKAREAIAEIERVSKLHPKEGRHHGELARALLAVGAGTAARRAARKAVEIEPATADNHVVLGWVLTHDSVGRRFTGDFDRKGARAAFERARTLDPKHVGAATELAMLLERSPDGRKFDRGSELDAAAAAYRAAYALDPDLETGLSVVRVLLFAGKFGEAEAFARTLAAGETRDALLVAAIGGAKGSAEAVRAAATLATGAARTQMLTSAGALLFLVRTYEPARALMKEANALPAGSAQATVLARVTRHDQTFQPAAQPQDAALEAILQQFQTGRRAAVFLDKQTQTEFRESSRRGLTTFKTTEGMTSALIEDILRSLIVMKLDGDASGWRIEIDQGGTKALMYAIGDRGTAKVIGAAEAPEGVGRHVLRLLAKKDEKTAARLLDWLDKDLAALRKPTAFSRVWGANLPRTREAMELAAAVLADDTLLDRTTPILERCGATTTDGQWVCDLFLAHGLHKRRAWAELDDHAQAWSKRAAQATLPPVTRAQALAHQGRLDDADAVLDGILAKDPDDVMAILARSEVAMLRGKPDEAVRRAEPVLARNGATGMHYNNVAWLELVAAADLQKALAHAHKSLELEAGNPNSLHTLASIEAELGLLVDAWKHGAQSMAAAHEDVPSDATLYVHARILEQLGLTQDALAAYRRIKPPAAGASAIPDSNELAARRLKALAPKTK